MIISMISIFAVWTILGYFAMAYFPMSLVNNRKQAIVIALVLGPAVWVGLIWLALTDDEFKTQFQK